MKNQKTVFIAIVFALAFALAPVTQATPRPDGGPIPVSGASNHPPSTGGVPAHTAAANERVSANSAASSDDLTSSEAESPFPLVSVYSTGNVIRGQTGSFVLSMKAPTTASGCYLNFSVSGTAIAGVDYLALTSPTFVGSSGYGVISVKTLPNPRGSFIRQAYSVVVTLEPGLGYAVGEPKSAQMWIKTP